jgi:hypothetical protein
MKSQLLIRSAIGLIVLIILGGIITGGWNIIPNILIALILGYYILHSNHRSIKLSVFVFLIFFIIGTFNILVEALIFNVTDTPETIREIVLGFIVALIFSPLFVYILDKWKGDAYELNFISRPVSSWTWRLIVAVFSYIFFYLLAGMILHTVYPELMTFYEGKIPPFPLMLKTQILRGLIFAGVTILMWRTTDLSPMKKAILIGATFSILGAIAPLIPTNEFMPVNIRIVHGFEVGISNFIFGYIVAYLLGQKKVPEDSMS